MRHRGAIIVGALVLGMCIFFFVRGGASTPQPNHPFVDSARRLHQRATVDSASASPADILTAPERYLSKLDVRWYGLSPDEQRARSFIEHVFGFVAAHSSADPDVYLEWLQRNMYRFNEARVTDPVRTRGYAFATGREWDASVSDLDVFRALYLASVTHERGPATITSVASEGGPAILLLGEAPPEAPMDSLTSRLIQDDESAAIKWFATNVNASQPFWEPATTREALAQRNESLLEGTIVFRHTNSRGEPLLAIVTAVHIPEHDTWGVVFFASGGANDDQLAVIY